MASGIVKWFNEEKGFGFIMPNDGGKDLFVHYSEYRSPSSSHPVLRDNDKVTYEVGEGQKGPQAVNVSIAE
jgi:CspA family cold shock protein